MSAPDTGPQPLDFDVLVRSVVDSRYMWISMENAVDMAVTTARLLVDAGAVRIVADGQPIEVHGSLGAMRRLVHSRGITADERDHDVAVSRPVPPLEGRERDRLREVLDAAGLPRDRDWDDVLLALRSMGARAVADTGQAHEPSADTVQARPAYEPDGSVYDEPPASTDALAVAISDPGSILPRDYSNGIETVPSWAARAVRALLGADIHAGEQS